MATAVRTEIRESRTSAARPSLRVAGVAPAEADRTVDTTAYRSEGTERPHTRLVTPERRAALLAAVNGLLRFEFSLFGKRRLASLRAWLYEIMDFDRMDLVPEFDVEATALLQDAAEEEGYGFALGDGSLFFYHAGADAFVVIGADERCPRCARPLYVAPAWRAAFEGHCSAACRHGLVDGDQQATILDWLNAQWQKLYGPGGVSEDYRERYQPGEQDELTGRRRVFGFEGVDWAATRRWEEESGRGRLGVVALIDGSLLLQNGCRPWRLVYPFQAAEKAAEAVAQAEREGAMSREALRALYLHEQLEQFAAEERARRGRGGR